MKQVEKNTKHCLEFCYFFSFFSWEWIPWLQPPILSVADRVCCREVNNGERHDSTTITSNSLVKEDVPFPAFFINSLSLFICGLFRSP